MSDTIRYLVMDVDGTLTDGKIYMGGNGEVMKAFDIKDGYGIRDLLPRIGVVPIIITGRSSIIVQNRCKELGIDFLYQGVSNKLDKLKDILKVQKAKPSEVAYIGDDLNDIQCMLYIKEHGGVVGIPSDAYIGLKEIASFVSTHTGGNGAVRDFIEYLNVYRK